MESDLFLELEWLPRVPSDFSKRCSSMLERGDEAGKEIQALAQFALDEAKLNRLARNISVLQAAGHRLTPLIPLKLAIVSNATTDFLQPALKATAARYGFLLTVKTPPYGQVMQSALQSEEHFGEFNPDLIYCALDHRGLPLVPSPGDSEAANISVTASLEQIKAIQDGFARGTKGTCVFQTVPRPPETLFGSLDVRLPGTWRTLTDEFNRGLVQALGDGPSLLLDVAGLAETVGLGTWHDPLLWNLAKASFSNRVVPLLADHFCRLMAAWRGKSRKCLVLDLDNTLWGGVIGDDGLDGIRVAEGDATGEAHLDIQRAALSLRTRGIVLAVSSKNDDGVARQPFQSHAEMVLRENHFAVFQANWRDKATNISAIADELALGLDSLVFLDDNPVERDLVRSMLPMVGVPELPVDPAYYSRILSASGLFESAAFSLEDGKRADDYQNNARRLALQTNAGDIDAYLKSLQMRISFKPFDSQGRARIAQLINKSNQFNLTTRRYSEADVEAASSDSGKFTVQVRLEDQFADNGMISVVICERDGSDWHIDTWLMSCRVLGRGVEKAVLQMLRRNAARLGITRIVGEFRATERNAMVAEHYPKLGFSLLETSEGSSFWEVQVSEISDEALPMNVDDANMVA